MEEQLIEFVKKHKVLYDREDKHFKRSDIKRSIWTKIATEMNLTEDEIIRRWRTLKDRYFRERRAMYGPPGSAVINKKPWKFMHLMSFLTDGPISDASTTDNYSTLDKPEEVEFVVSNLMVNKSFEDFIPSENMPNVEQQEDCLKFSSSSSSTSSTPSASAAPRKKRKLRDSTSMENTRKEMTELIKTVKSSLTDVNPINSFFNSMACLASNSNLSVENLILMQTKVMNVVHEIVLKQNKENKKK